MAKKSKRRAKAKAALTVATSASAPITPTRTTGTQSHDEENQGQALTSPYMLARSLTPNQNKVGVIVFIFVSPTILNSNYDDHCLRFLKL
jgi:hypothetical protein